MKDARIGASKSPRFHTYRFSRLRLAPAVLAVLLGATACDDSTGPRDNGQLPPPPLANAALLIEVVSDGSERIIPNLPEGPMRDDLLVSFRVLTGALQTGRVVQVRSSLAGANAAIARYAGPGDAGVNAELDALHLALDFVAVELTVQTGS